MKKKLRIIAIISWLINWLKTICLSRNESKVDYKVMTPPPPPNDYVNISNPNFIRTTALIATDFTLLRQQESEDEDTILPKVELPPPPPPPDEWSEILERWGKFRKLRSQLTGELAEGMKGDSEVELPPSPPPPNALGETIEGLKMFRKLRSQLTGESAEGMKDNGFNDSDTVWPSRYDYSFDDRNSIHDEPYIGPSVNFIPPRQQMKNIMTQHTGNKSSDDAWYEEKDNPFTDTIHRSTRSQDEIVSSFGEVGDGIVTIKATNEDDTVKYCPFSGLSKQRNLTDLCDDTLHELYCETGMVHTAKSLEVSLPVLKLKCGTNNVERWPNYHKSQTNVKNANINHQNTKDDAHKSTGNQDKIVSSFGEARHSSNVTIKVTYEDDIVKFPFSVSSGMSDLKEQVCKRLVIDFQIKLKYMDDDGDLVLIACDDTLQELFSSRLSRSVDYNSTFDFLVFPIKIIVT